MPDTTPEFNSSLLYLNLVNGLNFMAVESRNSMNIQGWYNNMISMFDLLSPFIKPATEIDSKNIELIELHNQIQKIGVGGRIPHELYEKLRAFHRYLLITMHKEKLLMKTSEDASIALR